MSEVTPFLPQFTFKGVMNFIDETQKKKDEEKRKIVQTELEKISALVFEEVKQGSREVKFQLNENLDIDVRKLIVQELWERFPKRLAFWFQYEKSFVLMHQHRNGEPPTPFEYKLVFD